MLGDFATDVAAAFVSLFPIVNPISTAVIFVTLSKRFSKKKKDQQILMSCVYMAGLLLVFLVAGSLIMNFFGISLAGVRIAGGLIVARLGFGMLSPKRDDDLSDESKEEVLHMTDIAFTPLAMPMMSGPGTIAVTISLASQVDSVLEYLAIFVGIILVALSAWIILKGAGPIVKYLGATGVDVLSRIMGFLLVCIGVQFIGVSVIGILSNEEVLRGFLSAYRAASAGLN